MGDTVIGGVELHEGACHVRESASAAPSVSLDKQEVWSVVYKPEMTPKDPYYNGWLARDKSD